MVSLRLAALFSSLALGACAANAAFPAHEAALSPGLVSHAIKVRIATASKPPLHLSASPSAFAVAAINEASVHYKRIAVRFDLRGLPIDATLCQTNPKTGQCLAAPSSSVELPLRPKEAVYFSAFVSSTGTIAKGTIGVDFVDGKNVVGSGNVAVTTKS